MSKYTIILKEKEYLLFNTLFLTSAILSLSYENDIKELQKNKQIYAESNLATILKDKNMVIDIDFDESRYAEMIRQDIMAKKSSTLNLTIKTTMNCNLNCVYCWQKQEKEIFSKKTQNSIIKFIGNKLNDCKKVVITWFGGEPMLGYEGIIEVMKGLKNLSDKFKISYVGLMSTNGTLLNAERMLNLISNHVYSYQVTIDGLKETHDVKRPFKNSEESSFDVIISNLKDIKNNVKSSLMEIVVRVNISNDFERIREEFTIFFASEFGNDKRFKLYFEEITNRGELS